MKSLGSDKQENKASKSNTTESYDQVTTKAEKIDFSNVKIEPLFEEVLFYIYFFDVLIILSFQSITFLIDNFSCAFMNAVIYV